MSQNSKKSLPTFAKISGLLPGFVGVWPIFEAVAALKIL
jgi:hypothetical protein|nr:MAG TPA: hypothetical protein [Caudoviricetes sp.]